MKWAAVSVRLNFKLGSKQTEHEDPYHRQAPWSPKSKIKVARSRDASDRCWPSWERNVLETLQLIVILPTRLPIMRTSFKVKGQKVKVTRSTNADTGSVLTYCLWTRQLSEIKVHVCVYMCHIYRTGRLRLELQNWYADGACAINCHGQL